MHSPTSTQVLDYAKSKSKATIVAEKGPEALYDPAVVASLTKSKVTFSSAGADLQGRERKRAREEAGQRGEVVADSDDESEAGAGDADGPPEEKKLKADMAEAEGEDEMQMAESDEEGDQKTSKHASSAALGMPLPASGDVPNNLLFCGDLPIEATDEVLGVLFQQYPGFRAVQLLPAKQGRTPPTPFAFIEFGSASQAAVAMEGLDQFKLAPDKLLNVAFAKRLPA